MTDEMLKVYTVCWCRRNIAPQKLKINYGEIEVFSLVLKPSNELFIVDIDVEIKV